MEFLLSFDIFTLNSFLQYSSKQKVASYPGLLFSILVYVFLSYTFFTSDMVQKTNPITNDLTIAQLNEKPEFLLTNRIFFPVFTIFDDKNQVYQNFDPTIWQVSLFDAMNSSNSIFLADCLKIRNDSLLVGSLCLDNDLIVNLNSNNALNFVISTCSNSSQTVICRSNEEIFDFVTRIKFSLGYLEATFDLNDYETPVKFNYRHILIPLHPQFSKIYELYVMEIEFSEYKNVFQEKKETSFYYALDPSSVNNFYFNNSQIVQKNVLTISCLLSPSKRMLSRNYEKLTDVLGKLGGLFSVAKLIGSQILGIFPQLKFISVLINKLYFVEKNEDRKKKTNLKEKNVEMCNEIKLNENSSREEKNLMDENSNFRDPNVSIVPSNLLEYYLKQDQEKKDGFQTPKNSNQILENSNKITKNNNEIITNKKSEERTNFGRGRVTKNYWNIIKDLKVKINSKTKEKIDLSIFSYLSNKIKFFLKIPLDLKGKTILKSEKISEKETDIILILKRIQDVEKLKNVLLNKEQRRLFDYI